MQHINAPGGQGSGRPTGAVEAGACGHAPWVRGHADNEFNNRCDALAVAESRKFLKE